MALKPEAKKKLRAILGSISTPEEMAALNDKEVMHKTALNVQLLTDAMAQLGETEDVEAKEATAAAKKAHRATIEMEANMVETLMKVSAAIVGKLDEVKRAGVIGSKGQQDYALTLQNMAASLAEGLGSVKKSIDDKPVPVWRWPQYLYSGLRDKQFSPINPATDGIGVGDYDYVLRFNTEGGEVYQFYTSGVSSDGSPPSDPVFKIGVVILYGEDGSINQVYKTNVNLD